MSNFQKVFYNVICHFKFFFIFIVTSIIPPLKKVSKYQTQLEKMRQWTYKLAKMDMRGGLKSVRKEFDLEVIGKKVFAEFRFLFNFLFTIFKHNLF